MAMTGEHGSAINLEEIPLELVLSFLRELVEIESPTRDEEGVLRAANLVAAAMEARGGRVERISAPGYGEHLRIDFFPEGEDRAPLLIAGHLDTVHPRGTLERLPWKVEGDRISGPGVFDMKGSWAAVVGALDLLAARGAKPAPLRLLLTCDEEIGAPHSRPLVEEEGRRARAALVLEPPLPGGKMKVRRKGMAGYRIRVRGVPAHAGIEPEKGASATHELVRTLARLLKCADPERGVTLNVGTISGGTWANVVAEEAEARVDLRFWNREDGERVDALIRGLAGAGETGAGGTGPGRAGPDRAGPARTESEQGDLRCTVEVEGGVNRWAMEQGERAVELAEVAIEAAAELGRPLGTGSTGGASDGQLLSAVGCPVLDGLGVEGGGAHALDEHILLSDLPFRIALYALLIERL